MYSLINKAKNLGLTGELYYVERSEYEVRKEKQYQAGSLRERGYGLRVFKDGQVGFAFATDPDLTLLDRALSALKVSERDENNVLPPVKKPTMLPLDKEGDPIEFVRESLKTLEELQESVNLVGVYASAGKIKVGVINTEGLDVSESRSHFQVGVMANYKDSSLVTPEIYESRSSRSPKDLDLTELKEETISKVRLTIDRVKLDSKPKRVVLNSKAVSELLYPLLAYSVNAENVYRKKSPLSVGEIYGNITVVDDPHDDKSDYSRSFDGEGQPTTQNVLIHNGEFKAILTNWYWSKKIGIRNSASAVRSFMTTPSIGTSSIRIQPNERQDYENEDLVIDQVQGVHTSNWDTGEFGVVVPVAWTIRNGDRKGVREVILSGDLKTLLKTAMGGVGDSKRVGPVVSPGIVIQGLGVVS
ncbi:TldD/PmbA family protein [Metallosphaera hakonensis]|uniref:TldD/PmbA family protein n=1 Tax=Metallosphaera hakonensis TaxID=79601 RepID=UPI001F0DA14F|nr:TldD/PmbA family protein [Metallosphaera hakonensis]